MRSRFEDTTAALRSPWPWAGLVASLALTLAGWYVLQQKTVEDARVQFERRTESAAAAVRARMVTYEQILRSGAAFMAASNQVTREDWRRFIANLQLDERFPGILSVGYAEYLRGGVQVAAHADRMRDEGFAAYEVRPAGARSEMAVVVYNEPYGGRNARAVGLDMYADAVRRAAMDQARESGEAAITARLTLSGEAHLGPSQVQAGFIMYVPVFHDVVRDLSRRDRRHAIAGFVFAPFRMHDLLRGILDPGMLQVLDMRIYDESGTSTPSEMVDTRTALRGSMPGATPMFERIVHFPMPGRAWTIRFLSRPDFDAAVRSDRPYAVAAGGLLASVVVFLLTTALVQAWNRARDLSMRDPLTSLFNRRYLDETMARELPRARRLRQHVGVIVLDLDHFKQLNDTYGHDAGDYVLSRVGELLAHSTRGSDIACRFGGEEFGLILPGATLDVARSRAEAIRAAYAAMPLEFDGKTLGPFTLSAGVASLAPNDEDWAATLRLADRALYAAKQAGRNRVTSQ